MAVAAAAGWKKQRMLFTQCFAYYRKSPISSQSEKDLLMILFFTLLTRR
jgi:hypothetical protein